MLLFYLFIHLIYIMYCMYVLIPGKEKLILYLFLVMFLFSCAMLFIY